MKTMGSSFESFPRLETPRLLLRQMTSQDAEAVFGIFSDERVVEYYDLDPFTSLDQAIQLIQRQHDRFRRGQGIRWGLAQKTADTIIGTCGLSLKSEYRGEVGYDLARAYWRQGFMTEALREVVRFGFETLGLNRIQAHVMLGNTASDRLLDELGFQEEGLLHEYAFFKGQFHDLKRFSILRSDHKG